MSWSDFFVDFKKQILKTNINKVEKRTSTYEGFVMHLTNFLRILSDYYKKCKQKKQV